ncbi:chitobiase/beta-hexosaminidase C-terminal domain-containing protein [Marispirochaeta aestuarii]|uniref:chitobiase/beta-hexosaminidase C-terminal domain-containing protein n=1 Tax=Marispirochaeta aestuarii TaxID=1963862 RepID=UPI0029C921CE|nr:chitobiase/beta-hexosaminidase C-terminal domain-containing protein [Marispirochaeta aestuarii]
MKKTRELYILVFLLFFCSLPELNGQSVQLSHPPGEYNQSVLLEFKDTGETRFYYRFAGISPDHFVPCRFPLRLSALPGEERTYRIEISDRPVQDGNENLRVFEYHIDKRIPPEPEIEPKPGTYSGPLSLSFHTRKDAIFYSVDEHISEKPRTWQGEDIVLQPRIKPYRVSAYSRDSAGNLSRLVQWEYVVSTKPRESRYSFDILSPAEGVYRNPQFLYVKSTGLSDFVYTTDGRDPRRSGESFSGGTLLEDARGDLTLSVAGRLPDGTFTEVKTVKFSVREDRNHESLPGIPDSGVYREGQSLDFSANPVFYTFEERRPTGDDPSMEGVLTLMAPPGGVHYYGLRFFLQASGDKTAPHYRYFYVFDTRKPEAPSISVSGTAPYSEAPLISILASDQSRIHYTLDGSDPDAGSPLYSGPFTPPLSDTEGNLMIKAAVVSTEGISGPVSGRLIPYDLLPPDPPELTVGEQKRDGAVRIEAAAKGDALVVFESGDDESSTREISGISPVWSGEELHTPWGMNSRRFFRFASRDAAGNLSAPVQIRTEIHRLPPPVPSISLEGGTVRISGSGTLFYSLIEPEGNQQTAGTGQEEGKEEFSLYEESFELNGEAEQLKLYRIRAFAEDEWGNRSDIARSDLRIDKRLPELPGIMGLEDRRVYNDPVLNPEFRSEEDDLDVVYSLGTDSREPPDPDINSPRLQDLAIATEEGTEVYYQLKLLPVFPERGRTGRITTLRFVVDRKAPEIPEIFGIPESGISADDVVLSLGELPEDETAYILIGGESAPPGESDPLLYGDKYTGPRRISLQDGLERTFTIALSMIDAAGNRRDMEPSLHLRIDRLAPPEPASSGIPQGRISSTPLRVELRAPENAGIEYRLITGDDISREGMIPFVPYQDPLELSGTEGALTVFQLEYRSFDEAGNRSLKTPREVITIDRRPVLTPEEPLVDYNDFEGPVQISWAVPPGTRLFYRLEEGSDWRVYTSPLSLDRSPGGGTSSVQYYLETESGITTAVRTMRLKSPVGEGGSSLVRGVERGGVYPGRLVVEPVIPADKGFVRFELGINSEADELGPYSPLMEDEMVLNVPAGMERRFFLRAGLYPTRESRVPQAEEYLDFTIDRLGPGLPHLVEGGSGVSGLREKTIELEAGGNRILYSLDGDEPRREYTGTIKLDTRGEAGSSVIVRAVALDRVGNRSRDVEWTVLLDQDIIYVAESGNDLFEGTRLRPFRSLEKALERAVSLKMGTIYIAEGSYTVQRPLVVSGDLELIGGLDPEDWKPKGRSTIQSGEYFPQGREILAINSDCSIQGFLFSDPRGRAGLPMTVGKVDVRLRDIDTTAGSVFDYLLRQEGGVITITDTVIYRGGRRGILQSVGGSINIEGSTLTLTEDVSGDWTAVSMKGGSLTLQESTIRPGKGSRTASVNGEDAYIRLRGAELYSGSGSRSAVALQLVRGQVHITGGSIHAVGAQTPIAVRADSSRLEIRETQIILGGQNGNTALVLADSQMTMRHCNVSTEEKAGFSFMLRQRKGSSDLLNCTASLSARGEPVLIDLEGGRLSMVHSSLLVSSSRERPSGIISRSGAQLFMTNSIVSNSRGPSGTALRGEKNDAWSIRNCNFGDWARTAEYGGTPVPDPAALNSLDGDPLGGWIDGNIGEAPGDSFADEGYRLRENSACVDAGIESGTGLPDLEGQKRPNPAHGIRPFPDIGADEFYAAP